jgi:hypothetical protein
MDEVIGVYFESLQLGDLLFLWHLEHHTQGGRNSAA